MEEIDVKKKICVSYVGQESSFALLFNLYLFAYGNQLDRQISTMTQMCITLFVKPA